MPVSGKEETGTISRQSSNCSAGVPIKKRRFPLVRPVSPPPQEPCSIRAENDSIQKECSNTSQGSSLSDASVPTNSPGLSDVNRNSFAKERKEGPADANVDSVQSNVNLSKVKIEESNLPMLSASMDNVDNKEKRLLIEKSACQKISEKTELHLAPNKELAPNYGKGIPFKQNFEKDCEVEPSGNAELSLGLKEYPIPALAGQNRELSYQLPDKVHSSAFCLSLGNGKPITSKNDENNSNDVTDCLHANRSNWDLNTTMDAWDEGSVGGVVAGQAAVGFEASIGIVSAHNVKPSTRSSAGIFGVSGDLGKQTIGGCEQLSNFPISSLCSTEKYKSEDSLHLGLSTPSLPSNFSGQKPGTYAKVVPTRTVPNLKFLSVLASAGNTSSVGCSIVKLEPCIENAKHDLAVVRGDPTRLLDFRPVKCEVVERSNLETLKLSNTSPQKLVEHRSIKSESIQSNQEIQRTTKETSYQSDGKVVQYDNNSSYAVAMSSNSKKPCSSELPTCSTELSMSVETSNKPKHSDYTMEVNINNEDPHEKCTKVDQVASETVVTPMDYQSNGSKVSSDEMIGASGAKDLYVDDSEIRGLVVMNDLPPDSRGNGEGSVSDDEKFNISTDMLEEDSFSSDYESDGNRAVVTLGDVQFCEEDDEYEDGEVREQLPFTGSDGVIAEKSEAENINLVDCDIKNVDLCSPGGSISTKSGFNEKEKKLEGHGQSDDHIKECIDAVLKEKSDQGVVEDGSLQELTVEAAAAECDDKMPINTKLLDRSGGKDVQEGRVTEVSSAGATTSSQGRLTTVAKAADNNAKGIDAVEKTDSTLPKTEPSLNGNDAAKDANTGQRSRIINLPRATNVSPSETRSIPGRSFPSRSGRYFDFDGEKLHPRGNRDETYIDGPCKFRRDRFQDHSSRNSRLNFMRGRGRVSNRSLRGDWDSERDFGSESYNSPADYRFSRKKHASADDDGELDCRGYVAPNGPIRGTGRGGRKSLNDDVLSFRHPLTRRRSPGGRDGTTTRGVQMVHRFRSPNRFIGEDGSDIVGLRRGEKFIRGLPHDTMDHVFNRPQPPFDGVDGQFVRGNKNFSSFQRRGLPRIRSKSPIRSISRSPGPWTSPRRRSPDGFNGLPELTQRRSPAIYRMERMRSPDRPCFPEEMLARRHGSPPYISRPANNPRDMESGRDHGHLRPVMSNRRSPSDQVLPRSTRRFDILDIRDRADTDEYFGEAMRSGRYQELGSDGNDDGRRKCSERRGPVRSFRPPYNGADTDNFRFREEDGPRPSRFRPEADPEFVERSNMREREFDGRIKNRSVNVSRQTRSIEEQEGNYRHGGQVWHDDGFDDVSRVKRRRF
ncbi:Serine-rich adhesin for platelets like [Actinidia chinensis var. chinensis]|uniref:Serine-rich adhesin for platelets like n=1 Tax=Actinidia chinensis var. chinensis TaxID=1590841 RepID=A0A2R6RRG7_ACTCC|nr:Serine-rich adhesin for platelets like [Actinidia chinensis var. chinensis]